MALRTPQAAAPAKTRTSVARVQRDDPVLEQQADRAAALPLASSVAWPRFAASPSLAPVSGLALGSGRPLQAAVRKDLETHFGHDFSRVRVHDDARAAQMTKALDAHAFASGSHVAFSSSSPDGSRSVADRSMLTHELAHVVQQQTAGRAWIQRKPKATNEPLFYQEALDELARTRRSDEIHLSTGGVVDMMGVVPVLEKFIDIAEAVEARDLDQAKSAMEVFLASDTGKLPPLFPSNRLMDRLMARWMLIGGGGSVTRLRNWYLSHDTKEASTLDVNDKFGRHIGTREGVLELLIGQIPEHGAEAALPVLDALLVLYRQMRDEVAALNDRSAKDIEADRKRRAEIHRMTDWPDHDASVSVYNDALIQLLHQCGVAIQRAYQPLLDAALADLAAGKGSKRFDEARTRIDRLIDLLASGDKRLDTTGLQVEITKSEFKPKGGKHLDSFATGKEARKRAVGIEFYDEQASEFGAGEMHADLGRIAKIRKDQLDVAEVIYGLAAGSKDPATAKESKQSGAAVAQLGKAGMSLSSDDDWQRFALEKYAQARKDGATPAAALTTVLQLLETFLRAFTTHTPYNIEDFGDNHLTRSFPRTLTGELIQDCGVYALRIAYILSRLRDHAELKLRIRFVKMPSHVGLVITGDTTTAATLPTLLANNDKLTVISAADLAAIKQTWERTDEDGVDRAAPDFDEKQFLGEMATSEFVTGVDVPFQINDAPATNTTGATAKAQWWAFYRREIAARDVFGPDIGDPKSPVYQFHLRYLQLLELEKQHYNNMLRPFWNSVAQPAWAKHGKALQESFKRMQGADPKTDAKTHDSAKTEFTKASTAYRNTVVPAFEAVLQAFHDAVFEPQMQLVQALIDHPEAFDRASRRSRSARIEVIRPSPWWQNEVQGHLSSIELQRAADAPPYARAPQDLLGPIE